MRKRKKTSARARAKPQKPAPVVVEIRTRRWGRRSEPCIQRVTVPFVDKNTITLEVNLNVRETEVIEVRPLRRDFGDTDGHVQDAERLANQPVH